MNSGQNPSSLYTGWLIRMFSMDCDGPRVLLSTIPHSYQPTGLHHRVSEKRCHVVTTNPCHDQAGWMTTSPWGMVITVAMRSEMKFPKSPHRVLEIHVIFPSISPQLKS